MSTETPLKASLLLGALSHHVHPPPFKLNCFHNSETSLSVLDQASVPQTWVVIRPECGLARGVPCFYTRLLLWADVLLQTGRLVEQIMCKHVAKSALRILRKMLWKLLRA